MSFAATQVGDDAGSPRPLGGGYFTFAVDIVQGVLDTGGDIPTPYTDDSSIEIEAVTPTNGPASWPSITTVALDSNKKLAVTLETEAGFNGRVRFSGR